MGATQALKAILVDAAVLPIMPYQGKDACKLLEDDGNYSFMIRDLPSDTLVVKCDQFPSTKDVFFKSEHKECKRADYVLVSESNKVIMYFELKHSNKSASSKDIIAQLKGAKCVVDYIQSIAMQFLGEPTIFADYTHLYYKGIIKAPRKRSFSKTEILNTSPELPRTLAGSFAAFGHLLNG